MAQKLSYAERVRNAQIPSLSTMIEVESSTPMPVQPPLAQKPTVNVWNVRMEQMAAIRAAHKNPAQDTSPSKSSPNDVDRDGPFVTTMPEHLKAQQSLSATVNASAPPAQAADKTKDNSQRDDWPQVGEAISISASSSDSSITDDVKNVSGNSSSPRKSEKTKWVSIPKQELQAVAAVASSHNSKRHLNSRRSHRRPLSNGTTNTDPSNSTSASASTSPYALSQSRTPSVHTSVSHSRAESLHSSPKFARSGKKLPLDSDDQGSSSTLDGHESSRLKSLPANSSVVPERDDGHRYESSNDESGTNKDTPLNRQGSSSQPQSQRQSSAFGYSVMSSESAPLFLHTNKPHASTGPMFYPRHSPLNDDHLSSANSNASNSSSPRIQQIHFLSTPSTPASTQSLHLQHPPYHPPHPHGQSPYPHAPYPLYNLSLLPTNSYDYPTVDVSSHSLSYPPNVKTLHHYGQTGSLDGLGPIRISDRSRGSPADTQTVPKSNGFLPAREKMVFGTIDVSSDPDDMKTANIVTVEQEEKEKEKKRPFVIGVKNGHDLPDRLKPLQKKISGRTMGGRSSFVKGKGDKKDEKEKRKSNEDDSPTPASAILFTAEPRWTFGTTCILPPPLPASNGASSPISSPAVLKVDTPAESGIIESSLMQPISGTTTPFLLEPQGLSSFLAAPSNISLPIHQSPHHHHPYHVHLHGIHTPAPGSAIPLPPPLSIPMQIPLSMPTSSNSDPDLEVKDYGYGFGDASGSGYAPIIVKERAREWEAERARELAGAEAGDTQALEFDHEDVVTSPVPENDSRNGADKDNIVNESLPREHIREHHLGHGKRGFPSGRGLYSDRGVGYRRIRGGINGFSRSLGRGSHYGNFHNRGGVDTISPVNPQGPSSPFNVTPPHQFQALPLDSTSGHSSLPPPPLGFYHPHPHHPNPGRPYIPPGYEAYNPSPTIAGVPPPLPVDPTGVLFGQPQTQLHQLTQGNQGQIHQSQMPSSGKPPVPVPKTTISFPLDSTRYYLLGQLEYYLSPENMAQDFYLRQQMDARGWIPISLIASFNRVRQLTQDVQLVKDVLYLSSLVQVRGNMVRMGGWEPFVLPDAASSAVEEQPLPYPYQNLTNYYYSENATADTGREMVNRELGVVGFPGLVHATSIQQNNSTSDRGSSYSGTDSQKALVNGHAQEVDEDDEDEVEIVMGQGVGTFMYDRRTISS